MTIERQEMSELLTLLAATEYISKQQGTPAPSEGSPEYKGRGTSWDYSSSTPPPDGAQVLQTQTGKQWWRAGKSSSSLKDIIDSDSEAKHVLDTLSKHGDPYIIGGSVRDSLLGIPSKDIDIEIYGISENDLSNVVDNSLGGKQEQV